MFLKTDFPKTRVCSLAGVSQSGENVFEVGMGWWRTGSCLGQFTGGELTVAKLPCNSLTAGAWLAMLLQGVEPVLQFSRESSLGNVNITPWKK